MSGAAGLIEHLELEAAEDRQALDRRRRERDDHARPGCRTAGRAAVQDTPQRLLLPPSRRRLQRVKIIPLFGAAPPKLKPITENAAWMSGSLRDDLLGLLRDLVVYSSDAPAGAWTIDMK